MQDLSRERDARLREEVKELRALFPERSAAGREQPGEADTAPKAPPEELTREEYERRYAPPALLLHATRSDEGFVGRLMGLTREVGALLAKEQLRVELLHSLSAALGWFAGARGGCSVVEAAHTSQPEEWLSGGGQWLQSVQEGVMGVLTAKHASAEAVRKAIGAASLATEMIGQAALFRAGSPMEHKCVTVCVTRARIELHVALSEHLRRLRGGEDKGGKGGEVEAVGMAARFLEFVVVFLCDEDDEYPAPGASRWRNMSADAILGITQQLTQCCRELVEYFQQQDVGKDSDSDVIAACLPLLRLLMNEFEGSSDSDQWEGIRDTLRERGIEL
eukprot:Hpha_TRINITY_DN33619_c0_g1::TRINITY_DN33619_c0_g1_i1::g.43249::m.43249